MTKPARPPLSPKPDTPRQQQWGPGVVGGGMGGTRVARHVACVLVGHVHDAELRHAVERHVRRARALHVAAPLPRQRQRASGRLATPQLAGCVDKWGRTSQKVSQLHLPKSMWCWAWAPSAAPSTAASRASGAIPSGLMMSSQSGGRIETKARFRRRFLARSSPHQLPPPTRRRFVLARRLAQGWSTGKRRKKQFARDGQGR